MFADLEKIWEDAGWMGKALHVPSKKLFIKPPYRAEDIICEDEVTKKKVIAIVNDEK